MKKGKFETAKHVRGSMRTVALLLALILLVGGVVGGTVAWLTTRTEEVVNTFTYGDINITLEETDTDQDGDGDPNTNDYEMIPGSDIGKDPKVTVLKGSEACYLFVKLVESENFDDFMTYAIADGWNAMDGVDGVYYREVEDLSEAAEDSVFGVLKDDQVSVRSEVTKEQLNALDAIPGQNDYPTLTITAYAVQKANIATVADAWAALNSETP